jgi:hypothetical protein
MKIRRRVRKSTSRSQNIHTTKVRGSTTADNTTVPRDVKFANRYHGISKVVIDNFVDNFLLDEDVNSSYIPDYIERQFYQNLVFKAMSVLKKAIDDFNLEIVGHKIQMTISPL